MLAAQVAGGRQTRRTVELPNVGSRTIGLMFDLSDYDQAPPSLTICDPVSWRTLSFPEIPPAEQLQLNGPTLSLCVEKHHRLDRPFICLRGLREYHEHDQHSDDDWVRYRGELGIVSILRTLTDAFSAQGTLWVLR